ncbi:MAG: toprim domain-containing protein [Pseudomonadota bacterium]
MNSAFPTSGATSTIDQLRNAMAQAGIVYDDKAPIRGDGKLHRFHVEGDPPGVRNGWYCFHDDARPAGNFGCNKRFGPDHKIPFSAKGYKPLSRAEHAALKKERADQKAKRDAEEKVRHEAAAKKAKETLAQASIEGAEHHPYVLKKGIKPHGARVGDYYVRRQQADGTWGDELVSDNALLIPRRGNEREIVSLQAIFPDADNILGRDRTYLANGETQGTYETIGQARTHEGRQVFLICEGFATGAALHETTGHCVVVAFDAGNLIHVAKRVAAKKPEAIIIIAADNDQWTTGPIENPGLHHARAAASKVGGRVALPPFPYSSGVEQENGKLKGPTDFDDLRRLEGDTAVKAVLEASLNAPQDPMAGMQGDKASTGSAVGITTLEQEG